MILKLDQGGPGELVASIKAVPDAIHYQLRSGPQGPGGATPDTWSTRTLPSTKPAPRIDGLTPGTIYAVQVRAYGKAGYTGWSDSATRMCI